MINKYIVEVKCPSNERAMELQLQIIAIGKKKRLLCVANSTFETTKKSAHAVTFIQFGRSTGFIYIIYLLYSYIII